MSWQLAPDAADKLVQQRFAGELLTPTPCVCRVTLAGCPVWHYHRQGAFWPQGKSLTLALQQVHNAVAYVFSVNLSTIG